MMTGRPVISGVKPCDQARRRWSMEFERLPTYRVLESVRKACLVLWRTSQMSPGQPLRLDIAGVPGLAEVDLEGGEIALGDPVVEARREVDPLRFRGEDVCGIASRGADEVDLAGHASPSHGQAFRTASTAARPAPGLTSCPSAPRVLSTASIADRTWAMVRLPMWPMRKTRPAVGAEAARDHDAVRGEAGPKGLVLDPVRVADDRERRRFEARIGEEREAEGGQAGPERLGEEGVALEPVLHPLFEDDARRLGEGPDLIDAGRREVFRRVVHDRQPPQDVGVIGRDGGQAAPLLHGQLGEDENGQAGRRAQAFLGRGQDDVDAPGVHPLGDAARGADAVHDEERARLLEHLAVLLDRGAGARGRIDVGADDDVIIRGLQPLLELARRDRPAPLAGEDVVIDAERLADLGHPVAEIALRQDQDPVARTGRVEEGHLHRQRPGARDDERLAVVAENDLLEVLAGLLEVVGHLGTDMGDGRQGQGVEDARHDRARAGDEEQLLFGHRGPLGRNSGPL